MRDPAEYDLRRDEFRARLLKFTRKAWGLLPELSEPRILDIGCGTGVSTLEVARLSGGTVVGIDIDQVSLDIFATKLEGTALAARVEIVNRSMTEMDFPDGSFDVVWAEGAVNVIGFERALKDWKRLLGQGGCMGIHDDARKSRRNMKLIDKHGYDLLGHFMVPGRTWWDEYYIPLQEYLDELKEEHRDDPGIMDFIEREQKEINMVKKNPDKFSSMFFVLQKR